MFRALKDAAAVINESPSALQVYLLQDSTHLGIICHRWKIFSSLSPKPLVPRTLKTCQARRLERLTEVASAQNWSFRLMLIRAKYWSFTSFFAYIGCAVQRFGVGHVCKFHICSVLEVVQSCLLANHVSPNPLLCIFVLMSTFTFLWLN